MKRVVLDTNILLSAMFWKGYPRTVYDLIQERKVAMLLSNDMEREFIRVLGYSKFGLSPREITPFIKNIRRSNAEHVEIESNISKVVDDPTDNIFLECAIDGKADYIISGDKHLLQIGLYSGIPITKAKVFLLKERLMKSED